jgi:hypothetical protein
MMINFSPEFVEDIKDGIKTQTVRRGTLIRTGDKMDMCCNDEKFAEAVCLSVRKINVTHVGMSLDGVEIFDNEFAREDGFAGFWEMVDWLKLKYGLPFDGVVISWELV